MLGEGKNRRVPKLSLPTVQQTETETRESKLADSKFSTRVAIWISPGNFVCETRWITFSIWWSDRKIYSCVINKRGWGEERGGGGRRTLGARLARKASFIGDASSKRVDTLEVERLWKTILPPSLHEEIVRSSILHTWDAISTSSIATSRFLHSIIFKEVR